MSELVTLEQIADMANVPLGTVRSWRHHNTTGIRFARIGRKVMARRVDVESWINAQFATQ